MLDKLQIYLQIIVDYLLQVGLVGGFFLVVLESIIPALPLSIFIGLNIITFGKILGYVISYFGTIVGCMLSFITFRYILKNYLYKIFKEKTRIKIEDLMKKMTNIDFNTLVVIIAIPFTPAFLVNIAAPTCPALIIPDTFLGFLTLFAFSYNSSQAVFSLYKYSI